MAAKKKAKKKTVSTKVHLENVAMRATRSIGSIESLIIHTALFVFAFVLVLFGVSLDRVLLVLTTILSLEAIYLAIFIQMTVNQNTLQLREVERDLEDIQEDLEEISEDIEEISDDIENIEKDIDDIQEDIEDISEDVEEMHDDVSRQTKPKSDAEKKEG